jgi:hypothetical protein
MLGDDLLTPTHGELTRELRQVREKGLLRLRRMNLPALDAAARVAGLSGGPGDARGIELLLRRAVDMLGDEEPGEAARYLFGLIQGTAGRRPTDLRERAASIYGLSPETFRKEPERLLIDRIAEEILLLCPLSPSDQRREPHSSMDSGPGYGQDGGLVPPFDGRSETACVAADKREHPLLGEVHAQLARAAERVAEMVHLDPDDRYRFGRYGPFDLPFGAARALITVDLGAVEELRDVDILVSSENTYFEPDRAFTTTLSGQLRNAAAVRDSTGMITRDTIGEELAAWVREHARPGNPVEPGVVVPTSPGQLSRHGVHRILHAAVAVPRRGWNGYDIPETGVMRAIQRCFEQARAERAADASVNSLSIPLFGAGQGGLDAEGSFSRLWPAVQLELTDDPTWHVHLTTWTVAETALILRHLIRLVSDPT